MVQFLDPEIAKIPQFLDPEIVKMNKKIYGSRNCRNGAISGSRNPRKGRQILYQNSLSLLLNFGLSRWGWEEVAESFYVNHHYTAGG